MDLESNYELYAELMGFYLAYSVCNEFVGFDSYERQ